MCERDKESVQENYDIRPSSWNAALIARVHAHTHTDVES